jgi:DNA polymerase-4
MPSIGAARKCAELVFVPPRFDVYREVSKQVQAVFKDYTPLVEPLSLDEAYLDVTNNLKGIPTAWETAKGIRARIYEETKLTASAGISYNKFLAKLASDYRKPNGQFAIIPDQAEAFVATLPVAKFHGVGPKTTTKMHALGIETGADLRRQTLDFLQRNFGKAGSWYYDIARGQDDRLSVGDQVQCRLSSPFAAASVRFIAFETSTAGVFAFEWALSCPMPALVQGLRTGVFFSA